VPFADPQAAIRSRSVPVSADRVRVLVANDSFNVGGAERVAVDVANSLDRARFEVSFCSTRVDGPLRTELRDDVDVTILHRRARWDLGKLVTFGRLVRRQQIDIIHTHGRGTMKFVALAQALGLVRCHHVFHDHFGWLHIDRGADRGLRRALQHGVDAYIGVDARLCDWARDAAGLDPARIHLVRSGVDVSRFQDRTPVDLRRELGLGEDVLILVMVANFRPQKDHPTLFHAIADLPADQRARLHLVICGSTTADEEYHAGCMAMADRLGISGLVTTLGPRNDTADLLAGADAAVLSSKNETGPLVVLEYMASGLAFVATDTGEITRAVRDLDVGLIPAPRDHREVAEALSELIEMTPQQRSAMGERGRRVVLERFSQQMAVRLIEEVYDRVLASGTEEALV
jgi:glycosyltransferase involved in cell wall biosynthesis